MKGLQKLVFSLFLILMIALPVRAECDHEYIFMCQEPTCVDGGVSWLECQLCGNCIDYDILYPLGHQYSEWCVLEEPSCTKEGIRSRDCTVCGFRDTQSVARLDHDFTAQVKHPTCTAGGYTRYTCQTCSAYLIADYTDALGHSYVGELIKEPTLTAMGRILYTCQNCADTYQVTIPTLSNPFVDVVKNTYYFDPVLWAVYWGITSGIDETHFGPDLICNRAQVAAFLWRSAGKPEPQTEDNPFADVPAGSFYEQAVLWAYETGITTGTDAAHFSPEAPCNRAQVVTFLHRFRGCPEPTVTTAFPDVPAGSYYRNAVLWAAQRNITVGMDGGKFCPDLPCTRGQIVTFLYRDEHNP